MFKLETTKAVLAEALKTVGVGLDRKHSDPAIRGVLLDGEHGTVTATDRTTTATMRLADASSTGGQVLIDQDTLSKTLTAATKGVVKKQADQATVTLTLATGASKAELSINGYTLPLDHLPVENLPDLPEASAVVATVDAGSFASEAQRVLTVVPVDDLSPSLCNMCVDATDDGLRIGGTDRYRYAWATIPMQGNRADVPDAILLPPKAAKALLGQCVPGEPLTIGYRTRVVGEDLTFSVASFQVGCLTIVHETSVSGFPKPDQHVPETVATVQVNRATFAEAATQCLGLAKTLSDGHLVTITAEPDGRATVAPHVDGAQAQAPTHPATVTGLTEPRTVFFNGTYLAAALDTVRSGTLTIRLAASPTSVREKPVVIVEDDSDSTFQYLLMPVNRRGR